MKTNIERHQLNISNAHIERFKPISSTYLVMLRRFQSFLIQSSHTKDNSPTLQNLGSSGIDEYIDNTISIRQLVPIFKHLEGMLGHKAFGIEIGKHMHPSDYGIFGYAMMNCSSVGLALETAARNKAVRNQNMTASFHRKGGEFVYEIITDQTDDSLKILIELDFSTAFQFGKLLVGPHRSGSVKLEKVEFKHSPLGPISLYEERFGCPVSFNQARNAVYLLDKVTDLPIYGANPKILSVLEDKIETIISKLGYTPNNLTKRVYNLINSEHQGDFPSAREVAQLLNMSLSSLKKHLKNEGTCYQDICESSKKDKSLKLLAQHDLPIKVIAFELGFSNPSAFNRAFKRWTGTSPLGYRKSKEV